MKTFVVIGLGRFGIAAAETLFSLDREVLVIDQSEELVQHMTDRSTHAAIGDARDETVLRSLGVGNYDCAIVAIGEDLAANILITMNLKDMGVSKVVCKAKNEMHRKALERIGADRVVIPEREMAVKLVQSLASQSILDYIEFSKDYGIAEIDPPRSWRGKTIRELNIRAKYRITVLALKSRATGALTITPDADRVLGSEDIIMCLGKNQDLSHIQKL